MTWVPGAEWLSAEWLTTKRPKASGLSAEEMSAERPRAKRMGAERRRAEGLSAEWSRAQGGKRLRDTGFRAESLGVRAKGLGFRAKGLSVWCSISALALTFTVSPSAPQPLNPSNPQPGPSAPQPLSYSATQPPCTFDPQPLSPSAPQPRLPSPCWADVEGLRAERAERRGAGMLRAEGLRDDGPEVSLGSFGLRSFLVEGLGLKGLGLKGLGLTGQGTRGCRGVSAERLSGWPGLERLRGWRFGAEELSGWRFSAEGLRGGGATRDKTYSAKELAESALGSRMNCSLRLDMMSDFESLGDRAGVRKTPKGEEHIFCRMRSMGASLSRRVQSDEVLPSLLTKHKPSWFQGHGFPGIRDIAHLGEVLEFGNAIFHNITHPLHHHHPQEAEAENQTDESNATAEHNQTCGEEILEPEAGWNPLMIWEWVVKALRLDQIGKGEGIEACGAQDTGIEACGAQDIYLEESTDVDPVILTVQSPEGPQQSSFSVGMLGACFAPFLRCFQSTSQTTAEETAGSSSPLAAEQHENMTAADINDDLVRVILRVVHGADWTQISGDGDDVRVWRTELSPHLTIAGRPLGSAAKFYCVKASGIVDASPVQVYKLFLDNLRVHEYNEFCKQVKDLEYIDGNTKITWSASGRMGPFKERDFVTRVHFRTLADGTLMVVNRNEEHSKAPQSQEFLRMEITLGANILQPVAGEPNKTHFTVLTHVNPGGIAETRLGTMIMNSAAASGPIKFIQSIRQCIARDKEEEAKSIAEGKEKESAKEPSQDEDFSNSEEAEFSRLLAEQVQKEISSGNRAILNTCPAGVT